MATPNRNGSPAQDPGQDPVFILQCLQELHASAVEFPIKVEGTHTLPYASQVHGLEGARGLLLKLIRPLPHELADGALFEMVFSAGDQRYQGLITFQGREAYLTYRFSLPTALVLSDRRRHKRYPFRPREMVDVLAQDAGVPGHGLAGPLVNLSMGGLAFRVDRIVKLDDGLRIPVTTAFFEKGRSLPLLRIRNLPKAPLLEARGSIAHVDDVGGQVQLGVEFGDLTSENGSLLHQVIDIREHAFHGVTVASAAEPRRPDRGEPPAAEPGGPDTDAAFMPVQDGAVLQRLQRRCRNLALVQSRGAPAGVQVRHQLHLAGFLRTREFAEAADLASQPVPEDPASAVLLVVLDADQGSLSEIRRVQDSLAGWKGVPTVFLAVEPDPLVGLVVEPDWRLLTWTGEDDPAWIAALDAPAGVG